MSWSAVIRVDGVNAPCGTCKHQVGCNIPKVVGVVGSLLTSVDVGSGGHVASGDADLTCNSFEADEAADNMGSSDGADDDAA